MKLLSLTLLSFLFIDSLCAQIYLSSQSDVDEFNTNYPSSTLNSSLFVRSDDIINLDGLIHLDSINGFLKIENTSLIDLEGLGNLKHVRSIGIDGNALLNNIDAILNLEGSLVGLSLKQTNFTSIPKFENLEKIEQISLYNNSALVDISNLGHLTFDRISMFYNESLSECSIASVCDHLISFQDYDFVDNAEGCNSREEIMEKCSNYEECVIGTPDIFTDFDVWDMNLPELWNGEIETITVLNSEYTNIEQATSIGNQMGHSLKLNTISSPWEGSIVGKVEMQTEALGSFVDISFDYCFADPGINSSNGKGGLRINNKEYWNTGFQNASSNSCDNPKVAKICMIPVTAGDSILIELRNNLFSSAVDDLLGSSMLIDNFKLSHVMPNETFDSEFQTEPVKLYPNPVHRAFSIDTEIQFDRIKIMNMYQQVMVDIPFKNINDVSNFPQGMYFIVLQKGDYFQTIKLFKS
jgi:hypothetical protein